MFDWSTPLTGKEITSTSSIQGTALGTRGVTRDGRVFRYAYSGMAMSAGMPVVTRWLRDTYTGSTGGGLLNIATDTSGGSHVPTSTFTSIKFCTTGDMSASGGSTDYLRDGYLWVQTAYNAGQLVQIEGNDVFGSDCSAFSVYFKGDQRLWGTVSDTGLFAFIPSPYKDVEQAPGSTWSSTRVRATDTGGSTDSTGEAFGGENAKQFLMGAPLGVTACDVADNKYFWLQTWGACVCKIEGAAATVIGAGRTVYYATTTTTGGSTDSELTGYGCGLGVLDTTTATTYIDMADIRFMDSQRVKWGYTLVPATVGTFGLIQLTINP